MREVFSDVRAEYIEMGFFPIDWENALAKKIWQKFDEERVKGNLRIKILFISIDIAPHVEKLLVKWFGPRSITT